MLVPASSSGGVVLVACALADPWRRMGEWHFLLVPADRTDDVVVVGAIDRNCHSASSFVPGPHVIFLRLEF